MKTQCWPCVLIISIAVAIIVAAAVINSLSVVLGDAEQEQWEDD